MLGSGFEAEEALCANPEPRSDAVLPQPSPALIELTLTFVIATTPPGQGAALGCRQQWAFRPRRPGIDQARPGSGRNYLIKASLAASVAIGLMTACSHNLIPATAPGQIQTATMGALSADRVLPRR